MPPAPSRRPRTTLAVRVTLLVVAVAVLVAVIASVVGVLVLRRTLLDITTEALASRADVIAAQIDSMPTATGAADPTGIDQALSATAAVLAEQGIEVVLIAPDGELAGAD